MSIKKIWISLLVVLLTLAACGAEPTPTSEPTTPPEPTPTPAAALEGVFLSEVLPGIFGVDNNLEFVEFYNASTDSVDLNGWSLWYRLADDKDEELVYAWQERADVPGHGYYLLVRAGKDVGNIGDATFETKLFEKKGGLALRDPDGKMVDSLVWGDGPSAYLQGKAAPPPQDGASLERPPGSGDVAANPSPSPQNSGDAITPLAEERLIIRVEIPASVEPGSEVAYTVEIENATGGAVHDLRAWLPLPDEFEVLSLPDGASQAKDGLEWTLPELAAGQTATAEFTLQSPWTYLSDLLRGAYVEAGDWPMRARVASPLRGYGPVLPLSVEGGAIPIGTARTLEGQTVTVEGIATMYTGGFYAGSTGAKFYLEDDSGGIQAYCPGGKGLVSVEPGDRVRVTGQIEVYRDSLEIIPSAYPDDVEVLERGGSQVEPTSATVKEAGSDESLLGRLIVVEGLATRIEEFSYSYEMDLMDDQGNTQLVYIEKEAGLSAEPLDTGKLYRVTGISELYSGQWQVKPRYQHDFAEIFPPELMIEAQARNSVQPGQTITYTLTAWNHTDTPLTNVHLAAKLPSLLRPDAPPEIIHPLDVLDGGEYEDGYASWTIAELGSGQSAAVRYLVAVADDEADLVGGQVVAEGAVAFADEWPDPVETDPLLTFVGSGVPIWAIQGSGPASPYVRQQASTEGIVIGVFAELGGFWIQEAETDDDAATSAGLFVLMEEAPVALGDRVQVHGKVRERSGQTMLEIASAEDVTIVSSGNALPEAVELSPPLDAEAAPRYFEALEGTFVQISEPAVAVGPTSKYGETPLALAKWGIERVIKGEAATTIIFVDDGSAATHYDLSTLPFALQSGDTIAQVVGPLAFTYENYKIEPIALPVISAAQRPLPSLEPLGPNEFSIATFNVENLFDSSEPNPSDPPLPTTREYKLDLAKTADAVLRLGAPTIVGLQEVENLNILADLVEQEAIVEFDYQPVLIEGSDSRGIDVGYLVRGDQATVAGAAAYPAPEGLTSRPPLLITTTIHLASGDQTVYIFNNHFTSMSGGEKPTEPRRKAQAAWNVELVEGILARDPEAHVVVLGDLNSFYDSPPLDLLRDAGLRHVYELVEAGASHRERPYSYIYQGESETLDHILVTPGLYDLLVRVAALHINADYPPPLSGDPSARRVSDHDPIIVVFSVK